MPDLQSDRTIDAALCGELRDQLRGTGPLVQCITNSVVTNITANILLAVGAAPAMVDIVGEAGPFAGVANGLLCNTGTPLPEHRDAMREAAAAAGEAGTPWVLDPVAIGALPHRTKLAFDLVALRPTAIRGNPSEILALAGGAGGRGVDSTDAPEAALDAARGLAERSGAVVAVSGATDLITDGRRVVRVTGGDPMLTRVIGTGCSLGALVAAFLGSGSEEVTPLEAVTAAHVLMSVAGEQAAGVGPGSFAVALLDALDAIDGAALAERARVTEN